MFQIKYEFVVAACRPASFFQLNQNKRAANFPDLSSSAEICGEEVCLIAECFHHGSSDLNGASAETLAMFGTSSFGWVR